MSELNKYEIDAVITVEAVDEDAAEKAFETACDGFVKVEVISVLDAAV